MKKLIWTAVILSTLTMCKKSELEQANNTIASADSLVDNVSESVGKFDSTAKTIVDSVNLKAKDLIKNKEEIEKALSTKEKDLFKLERTIFLYDVSNTYFEGTAKSNPKAQRGHSKEKRADAPFFIISSFE